MTALFSFHGVHCVVDGQFGSTGKGALTSWLAHQLLRKQDLFSRFAGAIYSGGPNSGHTFYFDDKPHVVKQLPVFSTYLYHHGLTLPVYLSAGAVIDRDILKAEAEKYPRLPIWVHPCAAIVTDEDRETERGGTIAQVAGTRSGTGAALARKILRDPQAIAAYSLGKIADNVTLQGHRLKPDTNSYFMEVAQGFSLGINSQFYPKVTSRECTVMQGLADARIAPRHLMRTFMAIRTFPIRVGNTDGYSSGDWYNDQYETSWERLGVPPELTTVTKRIRRVATFSMIQFEEACLANDPDYVFVSHMDYLKPEDQTDMLEGLLHVQTKVDRGYGIIIGKGPRVSDIEEYVNGEFYE